LQIQAVPAFLLSAFAALRLGKFNLDERQQHGFIGLPTPSVTLFSVGLLLSYERGMLGIWFNPWALYALVALLSWLMHAPIPMFSLKFKSGGWAGNEIKYIFVGVSLALLFLFQGVAFAGIILMYVCLSVGLYLWKRK
jgi:CDP-diacylglycerol--serine O-phosphatidyltransferase